MSKLNLDALASLGYSFGDADAEEQKQKQSGGTGGQAQAGSSQRAASPANSDMRRQRSPSNGEEKPLEGYVGRLNDKGYGFIKPDDGGPDVFFHRSTLQGEEFDTIKMGAIVEYTKDRESDRVRAGKVWVLDKPPKEVEQRGGGRGGGYGGGRDRNQDRRGGGRDREGGYGRRDDRRGGGGGRRGGRDRSRERW